MSDPDNAEAVTLRQQIGTLPAYVLAAWRIRYVPVDGLDLEARAILNQEATAVRGAGNVSDALTVWMRLCDLVVRVGAPSPELLAATALAGLAAGLRPQGFSMPDKAKQTVVETD